MKRSAPVVIAAALLLTGCAPAAPDRDQIADRFLIEYTDNEGLRDSLRDPALGFADAMLNGDCGNEAAESGIGDDDMFYAWRVTCLTYFEGDLTDSQIAQTKEMVVAKVAESAD